MQLCDGFRLRILTPCLRWGSAKNEFCCQTRRVKMGVVLSMRKSGHNEELKWRNAAGPFRAQFRRVMVVSLILTARRVHWQRLTAVCSQQFWLHGVFTSEVRCRNSSRENMCAWPGNGRSRACLTSLRLNEHFLTFPKQLTSQHRMWLKLQVLSEQIPSFAVAWTRNGWY